jgi:Uma2 family endonuclease
MSAHPQPGITPEEYLAIEREAEFRNEYCDGVMYAMSGGPYSHGLIIGTLARAVGNRLGGKKCGVVPSDLRVQIGPRAYTYPDVVVVCGDPTFIDKRTDTLLNPTLLIEVLSPSSEGHDRKFKSKYYRQIESLQEYALIRQTEPHVEIYRRLPDGDWLLHEPAGMDATCRFESVGCSIPVSEIYYQVTFEE